MKELAYTNTDAIRGFLGLEAQELDDDQIVSPELELEVTVLLESWFPTHEDSVAAADLPEATTDQKRIPSLLKLYTGYLASAITARRLSMLAAQTIGDGKNQFTRFATDAELIQASLGAQVSLYKTMILKALGNVIETPMMSHLIGVGLTPDPVTGQ